MCAISLVKNEYVLAPDVLRYKGEAIHHINANLGSSSSYECTIGAILLLAGVEWRTKATANAQIHLRGIAQLLRVAEAENRGLSATVRRSVFWQDVNAAVVGGTNRVLDRAAFPKFLWGRTTFSVDWALLPSGFEDVRDELDDATVEILQDVYVLQKHSQTLMCCKFDLEVVHHMDNIQACIEARVLDRLQDAEQNKIKTIVLLTAYLYTYSLFTQI